MITRMTVRHAKRKVRSWKSALSYWRIFEREENSSAARSFLSSRVPWSVTGPKKTGLGNLFPVREGYFPDPVIFLARFGIIVSQQVFLDPATRQIMEIMG